MRAIRALLLFGIALGLVGVAGYLMPGSQLAVPAAIAGLGSFLLAVA